MVMKASPRKSAEKTVVSGLPKVIAAGEFKARCLQLMDQALESGESITITKRGRVVAKLVPQREEPKPFRPLYGRLKGSVTIHGDIIGPTGVEWEADVRNI
jgi:prevent-host-death family protein